MIKVKSIIGSFVFGIMWFLPCIIQAASTLLRGDKIVIVVNSDAIAQSKLDKKIAMLKRQLGDKSGSIVSGSLRQKAIDELIDTSLQIQLARRNGIKISDKELDGAVANIAKANHLTLAEFEEVLSKREGMNLKEFRNQLREQGLISRVQQSFLGGRITVTPKEIEDVLHSPPKIDSTPAQYHVVDVLFEVADGASRDQVELITNAARQALVELQHGGNLDEIIKEREEGLKGLNIRSDDLGWRRLDDLPPLFAKEVAVMKANQVVGPLRAPNGLHLLKLLATQGSSGSSAKFTKDMAGEIVYRRKLNEKLGPWLKELREAAYIKVSK